MSSILFAFIILAFLGAALGIGLAFADKKFAIEKDPKLSALEEIMPGANCGGCGFAGCSAYAEAVCAGKAQVGLCSPGGQDLANKMGQIMGVEVATQQKMVAFVFCKGNCTKTAKDYKYYGLEDCNAASLLFKGDNGCKEGCLHLGSCIKVCDSNAIYKNSDGEVVVDTDKCLGCGRCTKVCPNGVIKLVPASASYIVACNSHLPGAYVRKQCESGCIGCRICENKFPESGFKVENNLAVADYSASEENAKKAADACPRKIIVKH